MNKGYWIGWAIGLLVAMVVAVILTQAFALTGWMPLIVGGLCGLVFTRIGRGIGSTFDQED